MLEPTTQPSYAVACALDVRVVRHAQLNEYQLWLAPCDRRGERILEYPPAILRTYAIGALEAALDDLARCYHRLQAIDSVRGTDPLYTGARYGFTVAIYPLLALDVVTVFEPLLTAVL